MGIPVLIMGESGSGKSASLRNFDPAEVGIYNVAGKPFPFRKKLTACKTDDYNKIMSSMKKGTFKTYVIDDSQYLMAFESFRMANVTGYGKFTNMAVNFKNLVSFVADSLPDDTIVYFLHHVETTETGKIKAKTIGKMLDSQITLEGLFSIVLLCVATSDGHKFITNSDGTNTAKSPMEMFPAEIDNDLKAVDTAIREYYDMKG